MPIDISRLRRLYVKIQEANEGDIESMYYAVLMIDMDNLIKYDKSGEIAASRLSYLNQLAEIKGYEKIFLKLGDTYLRGIGVETDVEEAIRWYEKAVEAGIPFGNECIGMIYYLGDGVAADYKKAFEYFTKNSDEIALSTKYALGEMYRQALGVDKDYKKASEYYSAVVQSDVENKERRESFWRACYRLGTAFHYGLGVKTNLNEAEALLNKAMSIFDQINKENLPSDISKEEIAQELILLNQSRSEV